MRVIAGEFRSRPLVAPRGFATRPTSDRLRETLFNVIAPRVRGSLFADLYAGSGATGIEALSRGAMEVIFVEAAAPALAAIRANLAALGIQRRYTLEPRKVRAWLRAFTERQTAPAKNATHPAARNAAGAAARPDIRLDARLDIGVDAGLDIVFLDPPYELTSEYEATLAMLGQSVGGVLAPAALVIAEHRRKEPLAAVYGALYRTRVLEQGDAALSFFAAREQA